MKYENIFPTGILVHDVPVWVANQVEKLVEERVDQLQRPDENAPHATDYFEKDKVIVNIEKYGNTTAGTIPIAMNEAIIENRIDHGDYILLSSFGAGFTWGSMLIKWEMKS